MSNYFLLELDTTSPQVEIIAPQYTMSNDFTEIWINSNEKLDSYQDIYILDSYGIKHNVIFEYNDYYFYGKLIFNDYPSGIATIYARLKDEMFNLSDLIAKTINIINPNYIIVGDTAEEINYIDLEENELNKVLTEDKSNFIKSIDYPLFILNDNDKNGCLIKHTEKLLK